MERRVEFRPAYDRRDPDPKKDYGIHGVDIVFYVIGEKGAVQFGTSTGWLLPKTVIEDEHVDWNNWHKYNNMLSMHNQRLGYPMPYDLGYHSKTPMYEDHPALDCDLLEEGGKCYYDGSGLNAYAVFDVLVHKGSEGVYEYLENYYKELFEGDDSK